jgi:putative endonuclease
MDRQARGAANRAAGALAEDIALAHLQRAGLKLLERNFRCRMGEVDLVMRDGDSLVFVEVRLRGRGAFAGAGESIDARKQRRIVMAARFYLSGKREMPCRFDCVLLERPAPEALEWIRNAFDA